MNDWDADVFDHSNLPFLRGGLLEASVTGSRPISNFGAVPESVKARWGSEWKKAALNWYDRAGTITCEAETLSYRHNYIDLDPLTRISSVIL